MEPLYRRPNPNRYLAMHYHNRLPDTTRQTTVRRNRNEDLSPALFVVIGLAILALAVSSKSVSSTKDPQTQSGVAVPETDQTSAENNPDQQPESNNLENPSEQHPEQTSPENNPDQQPVPANQKNPSEQQPEQTNQKNPSEQQPEQTNQKNPSEKQPEQTNQKNPSEQQPEQTNQNNPSEQQPAPANQKNPSEQQPEQTNQNNPSEQQPEQTNQKNPSEQQPAPANQKNPSDQQQQEQQQQTVYPRLETHRQSGWTKVTERWPQESEAYFVANKIGYHSITAQIPMDLIDKEVNIDFELEFYYAYKNILPEMRFVPCLSDDSLQRVGGLEVKELGKEKVWNRFKRRVNMKNCKKRNKVTFYIILHDMGDIFAWNRVVLKKTENQATLQLARPSAEKPVRDFLSSCSPHSCDKKQFTLDEFIPMVRGVPKRDGVYWINDGSKELKLQLNSKHNLSLVDICFNIWVYMDEGTKLRLVYPHKAPETSAVREEPKLVPGDAKANGSTPSAPASGSPTGENKAAQQAHAQINLQRDPQAAPIHAPAVASASGQEVPQMSTPLQVAAVMEKVVLATIEAPSGKQASSWVERKMCVSDEIPRLPIGSTNNEFFLVPDVRPNQMIGVQLNVKSGVAFHEQVISRQFLPNLRDLTASNFDEYWKYRRLNEVSDDTKPTVSFVTKSPSSNGTAGGKLIKIDNINPQQRNSFDLITQWFKIGDRGVERLSLDYKAEQEDWIDSIDVGSQRAGENWFTMNAFKADPSIKKDEIHLSITVQNMGDEEFRLMIRHNLTGEAKAAAQPLSLSITSLSVGDPCINATYCENMGTCKAVGPGQAKCECPQGYLGDRCQEVHPCQVMHNGRTGEDICSSMQAECVKNIPVFRCIWPNDKYLRCSGEDSTNKPSVEELTKKLDKNSQLIIIMGSLISALSLFAVVIIGNLVMRLMSARKKFKSAEEAREMSLRAGPSSPRVPKYGRPGPASFNNQAFDD